MGRMDRKQLVALVKQIKQSSACVMDLDALLHRFEVNVPNPQAVQMIFDPPGGRDLTAEEIVDYALGDRSEGN